MSFCLVCCWGIFATIFCTIIKKSCNLRGGGGGGGGGGAFVTGGKYSLSTGFGVGGGGGAEMQNYILTINEDK